VCRTCGSPFLPVDGVSWEQAGAFCKALTTLERNRLPRGYVYRLPTESEWEYACRAGSEEDFSVEPEGFWSSETSGWQLHEVGSGAANAWNLFDMHGNVSEWCLDNWIDPLEAPPASVDDAVVLPKDLKGDFVLRGGAWWRSRGHCSSRARESCRNQPGGHRGFRVVLGPMLQ
jgi:formylglycine-generating enzyme required for sulfatase activity